MSMMFSPLLPGFQHLPTVLSFWRVLYIVVYMLFFGSSMTRYEILTAEEGDIESLEEVRVVVSDLSRKTVDAPDMRNASYRDWGYFCGYRTIRCCFEPGGLSQNCVKNRENDNQQWDLGDSLRQRHFSLIIYC